MHLESCTIKVPYKGCDSEVHPLPNLLIKCHTSNLTSRPLHREKSYKKKSVSLTARAAL